MWGNVYFSDAQATAETAFRSLDMASFYMKWMQDMQDAQHPNGALSSTIPYAKHIPPVDPSWPTVYPQVGGQSHVLTVLRSFMVPPSSSLSFRIA
jgi:hypothetical protein